MSYTLANSMKLDSDYNQISFDLISILDRKKNWHVSLTNSKTVKKFGQFQYNIDKIINWTNLKSGTNFDQFKNEISKRKF